jgi:IS30 family transposase
MVAVGTEARRPIPGDRRPISPNARSPWQHGTNQKVNVLIREYLPERDINSRGQEICVSHNGELNDRPRAMLRLRKLREVFTELMLREAVIPSA